MNSTSFPDELITPVRLSRHGLIKGSGPYWDTCRRDDTDTRMYGPMVMPFALPKEMLCEDTSAAIWAQWYGGLKNARTAGKHAARRQTVGEHALCGDLRSLDVMERLTRRLDMDLATVMITSDNSAMAHCDDHMPMLKLNEVMEQVVGGDVIRSIYDAVISKERGELTALIEQFFPVMKELHSRGLLLRGTCQHLLGLGQLLPKLKQQHLVPSELGVIKLLIACIIRSLPSRLGIAIAVTTPEFSDIFATPPMFMGLQSKDIANGESLWDLVPEGTIEETVTALEAFSFSAYTNAYVDDEDFFDELVSSIDKVAFTIESGHEAGDSINQIYQKLIGECALAELSVLKTLMTAGGKFFAVQTPDIPEDLIQPGLNVAISGREKEALSAVFNLTIACYMQSGAYNDLEALAEYEKALEAAGEQIKSLSESGNPKKIAQVDKVGKTAMGDLERGREWFVSLIPGVINAMESWKTFNEKVWALRNQPK